MMTWEHMNLLSGIKVSIQIICFFNIKWTEIIKLLGWPELQQYIKYISETEFLNAKHIHIMNQFWNNNEDQIHLNCHLKQKSNYGNNWNSQRM